MTFFYIFQNVLIGDMSPRPLDDLSILIDEVFYPVLTNENNLKAWPESIKKDVESQLSELRNSLIEVRFFSSKK